jgi:hypothetical protein
MGIRKQRYIAHLGSEGLFVNFVNFLAPGSGFGSAFSFMDPDPGELNKFGLIVSYIFPITGGSKVVLACFSLFLSGRSS